jgi:GDP-L-fucose synthase
MDGSHQAKVERFVFLGSSCIYPRECPQPIKEEYLMTGPLEPTNSAYAIAKIAGIEMIKSYRKQFNHKWISVMPTNMYGPNDNFSKDQGHVLPALINRFVNAVESGAESLTLWGSGSPMREFLHSRDLAGAVVFLLERYDDDLHINVGSGQDLQISELAKLIGEEVGFKGAIEWDRSRPDGTPRKILDSSRIRNLGWGPKISLEDGIRETIDWFMENKSRVRS